MTLLRGRETSTPEAATSALKGGPRCFWNRSENRKSNYKGVLKENVFAFWVLHLRLPLLPLGGFCGTTHAVWALGPDKLFLASMILVVNSDGLRVDHASCVSMRKARFHGEHTIASSKPQRMQCVSDCRHPWWGGDGTSATLVDEGCTCSCDEGYSSFNVFGEPACEPKALHFWLCLVALTLSGMCVCRAQKETAYVCPNHID